MKNNNIMRIGLGIKEIWENKWKVLFLIIYLLIMYSIWEIGKENLPTFNSLQLSRLYICIFDIFMMEITTIGIMLILIRIGTPMKSAEIEQALSEVGLVDNKGSAPKLVSRKKDKKGLYLEFYSFRIPFGKYEKLKEELETALNMRIVSIEQGKDVRHVIIKAMKVDGIEKDIIAWNDKFLSKKDFEIVLGESCFGTESIDISVIPHILIGGGTNSGKSMLQKLMLMQCIKKEALVYLADFKGSVDYTKKWRNKCTIVTKTEQLADVLSSILNIMEERRIMFVNEETPNLSAYNKKTNADLKRIIIACDEIAEVLDKTGLDKDEKIIVAKIESQLSTIARQGRAFGVHLILATQRPDSDILKGQIKINMGYRICGRADKVLSQIILDNSEGADKIPSDAQGLFMTNMNTLFKAYYIGDDYCFEGE